MEEKRKKSGGKNEGPHQLLSLIKDRRQLWDSMKSTMNSVSRSQ